jgi:hypothetical protein
MLKFPGMRPYVVPGFGRLTRLGRMDHSGDNWWCAGSPEPMQSTITGQGSVLQLPEPLHALYAKRLRGRIEAAVGQGARAMRDFLPQIDVEYVAQDAMERVTGSAEAFRNVNTPEDAARFAVQM